jgi:mono/diheme cytochrome c family protein
MMVRIAPERLNVMRCLLVLLASFVLLTMGSEQGAPGSADAPKDKPAAQAPSFQSDIRPLLQAKCARCHGAKVHRADLDLSTPASVMKGGESGVVIVAGKPEQSPLYEKVHAGLMPPDMKDRLSAAEVETIRRWIAAGAKFGSEDPTTTALTQHDVIPILLRRCTMCHGLRRQEASLDLHSKASMLRGGKSGPAIVPGKPEESLLIKKTRAGQMPPRDRLVEVSVKPIESAEIDAIAKWIAAGAPEVHVEPDVATTTPDPLVSDKDREFWAFRAPRPVAVPAVRNSDLVRNPIDAFILQKLEQRGLTLAPEADRATLLRRASFDLTGLPPEPSEVEAFLADRAPDAYERLIDRLLASPRYGERWGRYWLDLAGYADSEGKREQDLSRPHAWRYRDYVVRAFNADKPYDRFLLEQLAGDELADYHRAAEIRAEVYDNLVATGFLRMAPDATWANITGFLDDRLEVIADEIDVLGSAVMGLTLKCARCHSHKFDPLPQRDYYRLVAVFKGAFDEYDWLKPDVRPGLGPVSQDVLGGRHLPHVTTGERRAWEQHNSREKNKLPEPRIHALWDRGAPAPTYIYRRGDPLTPGKLVGPGVPSVLTDGKTSFEVKPPWPGATSTGRRLAFARWLTQPDHPLTARVAVNRIWKHHFGAGIVKTLGNFGKAGALPTHPELLDWLAGEFTQQSWSIKKLHRLMMTSATYRQSSAVTPQHEKLDPDNALYSRMPMVRLDAEALYDSLLLIAGRLDERRFGPGDTVAVRPDGLATPQGTERGWRRMIYVQQARKRLPTHLETFDYPQMNPNCLERRDSTVAPQALHLTNNGMVQQLAERFAHRVSLEAGADPVRQVERAYLIALSRLPGDEERQIGVDSLAKLAEQWSDNPAAGGKLTREAANLKALTTYCHALMNSASFLYVD